MKLRQCLLPQKHQMEYRLMILSSCSNLHISCNVLHPARRTSDGLEMSRRRQACQAVVERSSPESRHGLC
jgi:hypothetical protein